jgi:hypothetical protein
MAVGDVHGELTVEEIYEFDNLEASHEGAESALRVALNFHANRLSMLAKDRLALWKRIADRLGLDPAAPHKIQRINGTVQVVECDHPSPSLLVTERL